jgi:D-glycero-D-manno-heptose 1,7-bisphosphate phosphatase
MIIWIKTPQRQSRRFLLLDRDGVINEDRPDYVKHRREFHFYPEALEALRWLRKQQVPVVIISNQSGLNRGIIAWEDFWDIHTWMLRGILDSGGDVLGACYCPHRPEEGCSCRKPSPGMIKAASEIFQFSPPETVFIGDRDSDMLAAKRAGCPGLILDRSGQSIANALPVPGFDLAPQTCRSLTDAVLGLSSWWDL